VDKGGQLPLSPGVKSGIIAISLKAIRVDISVYIQDLLWDYECVIIPGFGGILATYRSAEIVLAEHTLYPPSKALAFNEYLTTNDGLLVNHMAQKAQITYADATGSIEQWVKQTSHLLKSNEEIYLPGIGRFHRDVERHLQFIPDPSAHYLAATYGLPKVVAAPILRHISTGTLHTMEPHRASYTLPRTTNRWAMAAVVLLFLTLATVADLLYQRVNFKPLDLNTASVLDVIERFDRSSLLIVEPKVSFTKQAPQAAALPATALVPQTENTPTQTDHTIADNTAPPQPINEVQPTVVTEPPASAALASGRKYYVMVGAYQKPENLINAQARLRARFPDAERYEDTSHDALMRIGFYAAGNYREALVKLQEARKDDSTYWLLVR
jgi:hypothetical protein